MTSERPNLLEQGLPFTIRTELGGGCTMDELVYRIDLPGSETAHPWKDRGVLRTVAISPGGDWVGNWRWPDDRDVTLVPENTMLGVWIAHILTHGEPPLDVEVLP